MRDRIGRSVIVDARDAEEYFGVTVDPFAGKAGHIPTARSLPARWLWEADGTYKQAELLARMAAGVAGQSKHEEILVYCGVGGYASAWWFVLTQMLGYTDVRIYDGSAEAWAKDNTMVLYSWTSQDLTASVPGARRHAPRRHRFSSSRPCRRRASINRSRWAAVVSGLMIVTRSAPRPSSFVETM